MIIVMPNGRAQPNDRAEGNIMASAPAFAVFEQDLLKDLIPFIESKYSVKTNRESRALAGRGAVLERSSWTQWLYPARTTQLQNDIDVLYGTPSSATARRVARNAGAQYAVIDLTHQSAPGLKAISSVVLRQGDWALLKLR